MTKASFHLREYALYILVLFSFLIFAGLYISAEQRRYADILLMSRAMEIQTRIAEINNRLNVLRTAIVAANRHGYMPDIDEMNLEFAKFNVRQMDALPYISEYLTRSDIQNGTRLVSFLDDQFPGLIRKGQTQALATILDGFLEDVARMQGNSIFRNAALRQANDNQAGALRDSIISLGAILSLILLLIILYLFTKYVNRRRQEESMRAFYHMFAHMTRSRIAGLSLFLDHLRDETALPRESREAARNTVSELSAICERLLTGDRSMPLEDADQPLLSVVRDVAGRSEIPVEIELSAEAEDILVMGSYWHLILDELLVNAAEAVHGRKSPRISVRASVRSLLFGRRVLELEVEDNGVGMKPDECLKATEPFFSTRGGAHTGLGLTSCSEAVRKQRGTLSIRSTEDFGTTVYIRCNVIGLSSSNLRGGLFRSIRLKYGGIKVL